ncbi:MAG: hypothetical protein AAF943_04260 [Pseudomonadota bacterium]
MNNKILTVSYGTFSCTLEGFEDSFGTMKLIAEYFRDLAADDRYFGAEPPQPDAEMLAHIAEKEVARRVHARTEEGRIVLSALDSAASTAVAGAAMAPAGSILAKQPETATEEIAPEVDVAAEEVSLDADHDQIDDTQDLRVEDVPATEAPLDSVSTDDVEETLEAEVPATAIVELTEEAAVPAEEPVAEAPEASDVESETETEIAVEADVDAEDTPDIVPGQPDEEVSAFFGETDAEADDLEDAVEAEDIAPQPAPVAATDPAPEAPAPGSIAAKLQRIRAVVAKRDGTAVHDGYVEDEHAEAGTTKAESADADADLVEMQLEDSSADLPAPDIIAQARAEIEGAFESDEAEALEAIQKPFDADEIDEDLHDHVPTPPVTAEDDPEAEMDDLSLEEALESAAQGDKAVDFEDVAEAAMDDEVAASLDDLLDEETDAPADGLTSDQEEELARELADVEAEIREDVHAAKDADFAGLDRDATAADPAPMRERKVSSRGLLPSLDDEGRGSAVSRLLEETDHQMDEPEGATRRDAFAHLRAAVAAKKADSSMNGKGRDGDSPYREDLAEVVRSRPLSGEPEAEQEETEPRPAPLKLVAEQRISEAEDAPVEDLADAIEPVASVPMPEPTVAPRRVAAALENKQPVAIETEGFSEFASEMGATTLSQLLEAAAAYMTFVEGRDQFSRPQLMTKVRQADGAEGFSREDGLRSFGQLLRAGKIEKLRGGRFTVSEDIGFRPDHRAAG